MYLREYVPPTQRTSRRQSNPPIESSSKSSSRRRHKKSNRIRRGDNNTSVRSVISQYSIDDDRSNISSARSAPISYSRSQSCANDVNYDNFGQQQHSRSFNKAGIVVVIIIDQVEEKEDLPKNQIAIQIVIILMMVQ